MMKACPQQINLYHKNVFNTFWSADLNKKEKIVQHPSYTPDLVPLNFSKLHNMKLYLKDKVWKSGRIFNTPDLASIHNIKSGV